MHSQSTLIRGRKILQGSDQEAWMAIFNLHNQRVCELPSGYNFRWSFQMAHAHRCNVHIVHMASHAQPKRLAAKFQALSCHLAREAQRAINGTSSLSSIGLVRRTHTCMAYPHLLMTLPRSHSRRTGRPAGGSSLHIEICASKSRLVPMHRNRPTNASLQSSPSDPVVLRAPAHSSPFILLRQKMHVHIYSSIQSV